MHHFLKSEFFANENYFYSALVPLPSRNEVVAADSAVASAAVANLPVSFFQRNAFSRFGAGSAAVEPYAVRRSSFAFYTDFSFFKIIYYLIVSGDNYHRFRAKGYRSDPVAVSVNIVKHAVLGYRI